jgi:hypothetical protein
LAISAAGSYIKRTVASLKSYAESLSESWPRLDDHRETDPLSTVWKLSFGKLGQNAQALLGLISILENDGIPEKLLDYGRDHFKWMEGWYFIRCFHFIPAIMHCPEPFN